jgi:hypothetical protein
VDRTSLPSMDSLTDENRSVFMKIDKTDLLWFYRFTEIRSIEFEIKILNKTSIYLKIFGQNRIQKIKVFHPTKIMKG